MRAFDNLKNFMKIFSSAQIRAADAYTIRSEPIPSIDLMERASLAFVKSFVQHYMTDKAVWIFCGTGNNGGDGLAIGRILTEKKYDVKIFVVSVSDKSSADFAINEKRIPEGVEKSTIGSSHEIPQIPENILLIDAIFGSGLDRPVTGLFAEVIETINQSGAIVVSVDIASGLFADRPGSGGVVIEPQLTISFQLPKMAFLLPENRLWVGEWEVVDIGLSPEFIDQTECADFFLQPADMQPMLKTRDKFAHKGNFGRALLFTGSAGKMGAAILSSRACLRTGTGLLTVHVPRCGYEIMQIAVPEAMVSIDEGDRFISWLPEKPDCDVIGIGPGIDTHEETARLMEELLNQYHRPVVIDADGLNIISQHKHLRDKIPPQSILTPHPKEFERIAGTWDNDYQRLDLQREFSQQYNVYIVFKGAHTTISTPDGRTFFNSTGNPGMATAGSGDVLTGIITSLLGQGYIAEVAATLGVYLHGLAGDLVAAEKGEEALISGDIIEFLSAAFRQLRSKCPEKPELYT